MDELAPLFDESRVFIAPTRFASGIPLKCVEAASYGLPMVITNVLSKNLAWDAGHDHLAASHKDPNHFARECGRLYRDPDLWKTIRSHALERVRNFYSREVFESQVAEAFKTS
jgi:glycosyltransferase involved in cell wall biosynthesis